MFEFAGALEMPINFVFLAATGFVAWNGLRYRDAEGNTDFVRLLFGCIAATFFLFVLVQDVLGIRIL